jgi:hypothetical protein
MISGGRVFGKDTIFNVVLAAVGLIVSLFLAIGGSSVYDNFGTPTPGALAARSLVQPSPHDFLGNQLGVQILVDCIFMVCSDARDLFSGDEAQPKIKEAALAISCVHASVLTRRQ